MSRHTVTVSRPAHTPERVELFVGTSTGSVMLEPDEARSIAAQLLAAADRADGVPTLDQALGEEN
ncbi:MAG TPA: hypothetical protein VGL81_09100 [Polyangiaceae bacterium]